mgnify:CR=1 FL=1
MNGFRKGLFATIVAIAFPLTQAGATTSTFDGTWNVRISSSSETCGNGATVAIGINNGQIASSSAAVSASGRVADAGSVDRLPSFITGAQPPQANGGQGGFEAGGGGGERYPRRRRRPHSGPRPEREAAPAGAGPGDDHAAGE